VFDQVGCLPDRVPVNSILSGRDQVSIEAQAFREGLGQQFNRLCVIAVIHHRGADIHSEVPFGSEIR
jgi:hypothetical protein